jgi:hypothetical protein
MSGIPGVLHADPCTCQRCCRKAAFGAIRRAVEVVREYEMYARTSYEWGNTEMGHRWMWCAQNTRIAIRAAIGSDKA